nr:zinc finger protein 64-like [Dermacentor andersoni]
MIAFLDDCVGPQDKQVPLECSRNTAGRVSPDVLPSRGPEVHAEQIVLITVKQEPPSFETNDDDPDVKVSQPGWPNATTTLRSPNPEHITQVWQMETSDQGYIYMCHLCPERVCSLKELQLHLQSHYLYQNVVPAAEISEASHEESPLETRLGVVEQGVALPEVQRIASGSCSGESIEPVLMEQHAVAGTLSDEFHVDSSTAWNIEHSCHQCQAKFPSKESLEAHLCAEGQSCHLPKSNLCPTMFSEQSPLAGHMRSRCDRSSDYKCPVCPVVCSCVEALTVHPKCHLKGRKKEWMLDVPRCLFQCHLCPKTFDTMKELCEHKSDHARV